MTPRTCTALTAQKRPALGPRIEGLIRTTPRIGLIGAGRRIPHAAVHRRVVSKSKSIAHHSCSAAGI